MAEYGTVLISLHPGKSLQLLAADPNLLRVKIKQLEILSLLRSEKIQQ